jgi:hypothetical protein
MSSAQFDPCRQWLGIDAVELGDPRRVLGLLPSEVDPLVVLRAADTRLKLLRGIAPGPFDMARNALIKRVEEAREAVLAQISAAPAPPVPVGTAFTMPPLPGGAARVAQPPQIPVVRAMADDGDGEGFVSVKTRPVYRKQSSGIGGLLLLLALLATAAGGLAWYWKNGQQFKDVVALLTGRRNKPAIKDNAVTTPPRRTEPAPEPEPEPEPPPETDPESKPAASDAANAVASDNPPADPPEPAPAAEEPAPTDSSESATMDEVDAEAIVPLLKKAFAALQVERFDDADDALGQAGDEATSKPAAERLAQWQSLVTYARGFADLRDKALAAARPGLEYEIDGKRVAIVEIDEEKVIYRVAGKNKTVARSRIPGKLLLAILTGWLNRKPANQLYLGAYHATKPEPDLEKAREAWQLAERGGADASELLPLLDDPVLVKAAGRNDQ